MNFEVEIKITLMQVINAKKIVDKHADDIDKLLRKYSSQRIVDTLKK